MVYYTTFYILIIFCHLPFFASSQFQSKKSRGTLYRKWDGKKRKNACDINIKRKKGRKKISMHVIDLAVYVWRTHTTAQPFSAPKKRKKKSQV
jgi:hypothetical protein